MRSLICLPSILPITLYRYSVILPACPLHSIVRSGKSNDCLKKKESEEIRSDLSGFFSLYSVKIGSVCLNDFLIPIE